MLDGSEDRVSPTTITQFEMMSSRMWPARESEELNGWVLRANQGITWRANSVLPLHWSGNVELSEAIKIAIEFYEQRDLSPIFKLTRASLPPELDLVLEKRGFTREKDTYVMTAPIEALTSVKPKVNVIVKETLTPEWIEAYNAGNRYAKMELRVRLEIMDRIRAKKGFALAKIGNKVAGVGLGVMEAEWVGLFAIWTIPQFRRRGVGRAVSQAIGLWAKNQGVRKAFLQVQAENRPAIGLYKSIGFRTIYTYWYRILRKGKS